MRSPRRRLLAPGLLVAVVVVSSSDAVAPVARAADDANAAAVKLRPLYPAVAVQGRPLKVIVRGRFKARSRLVLQRRAKGRWRVAVRGKARRRTTLNWRGAPAGVQTLRVRLVRGKRVLGTSPVRRLRVSPKRTKQRPVVGVPTPGAVAGVPAPGQPGTVRLHGASALKAGDFLAVGVGPATPSGFLGKVTAARVDGNETILQTTPTTLPEAVPEGSINGVRTVDTRSGGSPRSNEPLCKTTTGEDAFKSSVDITPKVELHASWGFTGLKSASVSVGGSLKAGASFTSTLAGFQCKATRELFSRTFSPVTFTVGIVPVVIVPKLRVDADVSASVESKLKTGGSVTVNVTGGAEYKKGEGVRPKGTFDIQPQFDPPEIDAGASLGAKIGPTLDLLLYGAAGPALQVKTGIDASASIRSNPWWSVDFPVNADFKFEIPVLGLKEVATVHLYDHTFNGPRAAGPFPGLKEEPTPKVRARIDWDSGADIDLHAWDADGNHAYFGDQEGIPGAHLDQDIIPGFGPENFIEDDGAGRRLTYGLCMYSNSDDEPTTINAEITDPDGTVRRFERFLYSVKSATLITISPLGIGHTPAAGWCDKEEPSGDPETFDD